MLKSKSVAKLIETTLNNIDKEEQFRVVYGAGSYKGSDINCVLKQGKGTITPVANYTNIKTPFYLEVITPMQCGEDRVDSIVDIVNAVIKELNGKVKNIDGGKAVFLFSPLEIGQYETRATAGQSVIIKLEFISEYSTNTGTKYEMALLNNPFHSGTQNTRYFSNREEQIQWFYDRIQEATFSEVLTPNINSLVITSQRYLNPREVDLNDLSMLNYAIIRETKWNDEVRHYYYDVTNATIGEYNLLVVDLKMDTLQTFYIDLEFSDCIITKAHLDRFVENTDNTVSFNTKPDSPLFEREEFQALDKRLTKRDVLVPFKTGHDALDKWYQDNIQGWIYMYLAGKPTYKVGDSGNGTNAEYNINFSRLQYHSFASNNDINESVFYNTLVALAFPVYKTNNRINLKSPTVSLDLNPFRPINQFIETNGADNIFALKFSIVPPFDVENMKQDAYYDIIDNDLVITCTEELVGTDQKRGMLKSDFLKSVNIYRNLVTAGGAVSRGEAFLQVTDQTNINLAIEYTYNNTNYSRIQKSYITGLTKKDINLNPKLYNSDYMSLVLSDNTQNGAEYDVLKLGATGKVNITYTEALTPDITKTYIRCNDTNSAYGIYINETTQNLTGFVSSDDKSLIYENDAFKSMLANNKNFFLQNTTNRAFDLGQGIFGATTGALQGAFFTGGNPLGAVVGAGVSIAQTTTNAIKSKINQNFTVDNLKNAPSTISGALGNVIFNSLYSDNGIVVETHEILPFEKEIINDQMHMNGFTFNKVDNVKKYDNIRKYFNYVEANIDNIVGNVSNQIKDDIRQRFANGIRFWNVDEISYENENYERWLEA